MISNSTRPKRNTFAVWLSLALFSCACLLTVVILSRDRQLSPSLNADNSELSFLLDQTLEQCDIMSPELGIAIQTPEPLGQTQFNLFKQSVSIGGKTSINKIVGIHPARNHALQARLAFHYDDDDLNGLDETQLILYSSTDEGKTWTPHPNSVVDPENNSIHLDAVEHFSFWTAGLPEEAEVEEASMMMPPVASFVVTTNADAGAGSLRQAILDANAAGAGPHMITFDPGMSGQTITIASHLPVVSVSDVTIDGDIDDDGVGDITIDANGGDITRYIFRGNGNADNATFIGFTLQDTGYEPFRFDGSPTGVTIENMVFRHTQNNWQNYGVLWSGNATDLTIRNVAMTQKQNFGGGAIYITGTATNVLIDNFDLSDSGGGGLQAIRINGAANNVTIKNCDLDLDLLTSGDDGNYGIWFRSTATDITIDNCILNDAEIYGIYFENVATDITLTNLEMYNHDGWEQNQMIRFNSTVNGLVMTDVTIDCEKTDNGTNVNDGDEGIWFQGQVNADNSKTAVLTRVSIHAADLDGIGFNTHVYNLTLDDCSITGLNQQHGNEDGIEFYNSRVRSNIVITNSTFDKNGRSGLVIHAGHGTTDFTITNNIFTNSNRGGNGYGVWLWTGNGNRDVTISGNTFGDNLYEGIRNNGPDGINITQNSMYNNGSAYNTRGLGINNDGNSGNNDFEYNEGDAPFILSSVPLGGDDYTVTFTLPAFCTDCDVEFFTNDVGDAPFNGRTYVHTVTGLAAGTHTATVNSGGNNTGFWTATLKSNTHNGGSVSEYSYQAAINPMGPGCVAAGIRMWFRGDDVSSGNILTGGGWSDFSGNEYDFTLGGSDPNRVDGALNFNHYVDFDANDHLYMPTVTNFFTSGEVFSVLQARVSNGGHAYNFGGHSNNHYRSVDTYESFGTNDRKGWRNSNNAVLDGSGTVVAPSPLFDPAEWNIYNVSADGVANTWAAYFNGFQKVMDASNAVNFGDTYNRIGHGDASYFNGNVSEIVLYDRALTAAERQRVNSYMALKYGMTLDQTNETDYLAGDGSIIWDAGNGYDNDIAGIGREDCQALNQKQSFSMNTDAFVAMGLGEVAVDNASNANTFAADKSFLIWGNDDGGLALQFTELPSGATAGNQRLTREWKVEETGSVNNLTIKAGAGATTIPTGASDVEMYIDTDGDGDFLTGSPTVLAVDDFTDGIATFNGVDLNDNDVFTFGWFQIAPGCVGAGLKVWLKGNEGVTQATGVSEWADQSGSENHVIQATTSRQPVYNENAINFNPAPEFDGSNDFLRNASIDGGTSTGTNSREIIVVTGNMTGSYGRTIWNYGHHPSKRSLQLWNQDATRMRTRSNAAYEANRYYSKDNQNEINIIGVRNEDGDNISNFVMRQDGTVLPTSSTNTRSTNLTTSELHIGVHEANNTALNAYYNGPIAEFIIYEDPLTATDRQKVESYLAIKYGVTLASDYLAGDGSTIWTSGGGYDNDIAGIGRDACQALNQKQSKSSNEDAIVTMGLGAIAATNEANANTFPADRSFMIWGNDDGGFGSDATALPNDVAMTPTLQGLNVWLKRKWVIEETGTVGTARVKFEFTNYSDVHLVTASDAGFTTDVTYTAMTKVGDNWEVDYDFSDGEYFTIAGIETAPGCVINDLSLWLKANSAVTAAGGSVSAWTDLSNNGITYTDQGVTSRQPELVADGLNFNPTLRYDGSAKFLRENVANSIQNLILVTRVDPSVANYRGPFSNYGADNHRVIIHAGGSTNAWRVGGYFDDGNDFGDNDPFYINGESGTTLGNSVHGYQPNILTIERNAVSTLGRSIGHYSRYFHGDIAEVVGYSTNQGTNERERIESYLAIKYGITLPYDYLAGDGTVVWDRTTNAAFNNDIAGIGYDACQALNQKQSKSVNEDAVVAMGLGTLATTNKLNTNSFGDNTSFMIWGNNDGELDASMDALPGTPPPALNVWMDRKWLIQEVLDAVASTRVRFRYPRFSDVYLVTADDEAFTTNVTYTPMSEVGENWEGDYNFADGQYFTFAGKLTTPGCVTTNLVAWYKFNAGVTNSGDSTAVSGIQDISGYDYHLAETSAGSQPTYVANALNFNPAGDFDGVSDRLNGQYSGFVASTDEITMISVSVPTGFSGEKRTIAIGDNNDHPGLGYQGNMPELKTFGSSSSNSVHSNTLTEGEAYIMIGSTNNSNPGGQVLLSYNGVGTEETFDQGNGSFNAGQGGYIALGNEPNTFSDDHTGKIAEAAIYNRVLTTAEKERMYSYLALKYGITIGQNYYAGNGTLLWDSTANAAYHHDIAGIGRDDCQGLRQKQSKSFNEDDILTIGHVDIASTNFDNTNNFPDDESFMVWGNNDGDVEADAAPLPAGAPVGLNNWLARKWLVQEKGTGTVGAVLARFAYTKYSNLYLVTASDAGFTTDVTYTAMSDLGEEGWEVTYDFTDGEYFTLAGFVVAPGGVVNGVEYWIRPEEVDTSGTEVVEWNDYYLVHTDETFVSTPLTFSTDGYNFNPTTSFNGGYMSFPSQHLLSGATSGEVFYMLESTGAHNSNDGYPSEFGGGGSGTTWEYDFNNSNVYSGWGSTARKNWNPLTAPAGGPARDVLDPHIYNVTSKADEWTARFDALTNFTTASNGVNFNSTHSGNTYIGASHLSVFKGNISEVVVYRRDLSAAERTRVNTYLAIKYGVTLGTTTAPVDYVASDGTTIAWTGSNTYQHDIAGIGRDDGSELQQKQSKSVNDDAYVTIGNVDIAESNVANTNDFAADKSFMLWGNDDGTKGFTETLTGTMLNRMERIWHVEETGTVGSVKVLIPFTNISSLVLVRSTDETFDNSDTQVPMTCDASGCYVTIDFADGDYFTFAGMVEMPFTASAYDQFDGLVAEQPAIPPTRCSPNFWEREALYENGYTGGPGDIMTPGVSANETTHLADVDNDGDLDIVWLWDAGMVNSAAAGVYFWKNNGDGTFETSATTYIGSLTAEDLPNGSNGVGLGGVNPTESTHVADVDGDGNVDLIWIGESKNKTYVWLGNGNGTWQDAAIETSGYTGGVGNKITPGITANESTFLVDVNTDGILDMVWVYDHGAVNAGGVYIWLGNGDGTWQTTAIVDKGSFTGTPGHYMGGQSGGESTHVADFTGDGIPDILWLWEANKVSYCWPGNGDGTFEHTGIIKSGYTGGPGATINIGYSANETTHIGDADNDGNLDIIWTWDGGVNPNMAGVYIWYGLGDGTFATEPKIDKGAFTYDGTFNGTSTIALGGQSSTESSHVSDLNGDGAVDLMWLYEGTNSSYIWLSTDEDDDGISDNTDDDDDDDGTPDVSDPCESPGGVITDLALWLRSDVGTSTTTSGNTIELWEDQGPGGYNASQPTVGERPVYQTDAAELFNFNPVIKFAGSKDFVNNCMPILDDENYTIFTVSRKDGSSNWAGLFSQNLSGNAGRPGTTYILSSNDVGLNAINQGSTNVSVTDPATGQMLLRNTGDTGDIFISLNGETVTATGAYPGNPTGTVKGYYIARHNATLTQSLIGNMAEVIAYNSSLTTNDINKIETYLAVKYGLTLNHNYVDSDNTLLWDVTADAAYSNDIGGIGRDDVTTLYQKQSKSIGTDALVTIGNGSIIDVDNISNTTQLDDDKSYMLWGNDDDAFNTWQNTNTLSGYSRVARTWKVAETTSLPVGAVKVQVPDDGSSLSAKLPTEIGSVFLLVDDDGDFTNATAVEMGLNGTDWEADIDFADGEYFTFAISCPELTIDTHPSDVALCPGVSHDFTVVATGSNLTYQWQEDQGSGFMDLSGETSATLSITPGGAYSYQVVITDDCGQMLTSNPASVTFLEVPTVTTDPTDVTACEGNDALFNVVATGENITYQWQEDQGSGFMDLTGENAASLTLSSVTPGMDGYMYQVVVSGDCSPPATSAAVTLTVNTAPSIATQPVSMDVCVGETATFMVDGGAGVTYQWERSTNSGASWSPLGGATSDSYTTPVTTVLANGYMYRVQVTQPGCSTVTSDEVTLTVEGPVTISTEPMSQTICDGDDVTFSVTADGGVGTLAYQWQESTDGGSSWSDLGGETNSSLMLTGVSNTSDGNQYRVMVSTAACSAVTSAVATLSVEGPVVINTEPVSEAICDGEDVTFSVAATGGSGTLAYQWQESTDSGSSWSDLSGETGSSLMLSSVSNTSDGNQYRVMVSTGACPAVTSAVATLTVEGPIVINTDPMSQTICDGEDVTFSVAATGGSGTLAYQWQESTDSGSSWSDLSGETGSSLMLTSVSNASDGNQYRVMVSTAACAAVTSAVATLTVEGPVVINTDPVSQTICDGEDVTFSVAATGGSGTLAYQWQESTDSGSSWSDLSGETGSSLMLSSVSNTSDGNQYRVMVSTAACAALTSAVATLTVEGPVVINTDPVSQTICDGEDVTFSVAATGGSATLLYQWQESTDSGSSWSDLSGETSSSLMLSGVSNTSDGNQYRVMVSTAACAALTSAVATLSVEGPVVINTDPASQAICDGEDVTFSVVATGGSATLLYQWQESTDSGSSWSDLSGETSSSLMLSSVSNTSDGNQYRVMVSTAACAALTSTVATLTVEGPVVINTDPVSQTICDGEDVTFSVAATGGSATLLYQWQESTDSGSSWSDLSGETSSSLMLSGVSNTSDGNQYRVMVSTAACAALTSAVATLTVEGPVNITTQPTDQVVCDAQNATFSVVATGGSGTLAYQWQQSIDGGSSWSDMSGETSASLTLPAVSDAMNGFLYRVNVSTGACAAVTSDEVSLTVEGPIIVSEQPASTTVCSGDDVTLTIMASTTSGTIAYQWYRSTDGGGSYAPLAGETGNTLMLSSVTTAMSGYRYRVGYSTGACVEQQSNVAVLTVEGPINITAQPVSQSICEGDDVTFSVTANAGSGTLSYQWQESTDGGSSWSDISGETSASYMITGAPVGLDGNQYRVLLSSGACAEIMSASATLSVSTAFTIDQQPVDITDCAGETVMFTVDVSGGAVNYQWEVSTDGGSTWNPVSLATSNTLTINNILSSQDGNQYRVQLDGGSCGMATSDEVTLTVEGPLMITTQPVSVTQCAGTDASFTAAGTAGAATPSYQWEMSTDGGTTWNPIVGESAGTLNLTGITASMDGYLYRMAVSITSCPVLYSNVATLSVDGPISFTSDPSPLTVCDTEMATFEAEATNDGSGGLFYQWQVSADDVTFTDISNGAVYADVTTTTLTILDVTGLDGMYYRLEAVGGVCPEVYSNSAPLTVDNSSPSGNAGSDETICGYVGVTFDLSTASVPASFADGTLSWTSSGSGSFSNPNIIHPVYTPSAADISNGSVTLVLVVSGTGNCSGELEQDEMELTFDVANAPTVNAGPDILVCTNDLPIDFSTLDVPPTATNGTVTWTKPGSVTGTFDNPNLIAPVFTPSMDDINNNSVTLTMTVQGSGGACSSVQLSDAITISFTGDNVLSAVLSSTDPSTICSGESVDVVIDIVGGTPPYNVVYTDGTSQFMIDDYDNGSTVTLSPTTDVIYELVYVEDMINCPSITVSGTVPVTVEGPVSVTTDPVSTTICDGDNTSFTVVASEGNGGILMYQWEVSTDGGSSWSNVVDGGIYSGATTDFLSLTGATAANDTYQYRVQVNTTECNAVTSAAATLSVEGPVSISTQPANAAICEAEDAIFSVVASGGSGSLSYQWEESTDGGSSWTAISDGGIYSGTTTDQLMLSSVSTLNDTYQYRVQVNTGACSAVVSSGATLTVEGPIDISAEPTASTICAGDNTSFSLTVSGGSGTLSYQWEESTDGGSSWTAISDGGIYSGATTGTLMLTAVPATHNDNQYRVQVSTDACSAMTSAEVTLTVNSVNTSGLTLSLATDCDLDVVTATLNGSLADDSYDLVYDLSGANTATGETASVTTSGGTGTFNIPFADFPNLGITTVTITDITAQSNSCSTGGLSVSDGIDIGECDVLLLVKVILQGAYDPATDLMYDSLRTQGVIPTTEPYTGLGFAHTGGGGGEQVPVSMFDPPVNPEDAIVDWVFIELRDASDADVVIATRSALLQRDGDVVDTNGMSTVRFQVEHDDYFVAVRHRNHLRVMTKAPVALSNTSMLTDFTNSTTETHGANPQKEVEPGVMGLWGGNADGNSTIIYVGSGTDVTALSITVLLDPANDGIFSTSHPVDGYHSADLDMNGKVIYVGSGTDQTVISTNVLLHPANSSFSQSEPIEEQQP